VSAASLCQAFAVTELDLFFSPDGGLAKSVAGYQPRAGQVEMARAIIYKVTYTGKNSFTAANKN
jgi:hypothetical protein